MRSDEQLGYLAIGHICHDLSPEGKVVGGAAAYAASTARELGCTAAVVTSSARRDQWADDLPGIAIERTDAPQTTVFENIYTDSGRQQIIHAVAGPLTAEMVPASWRRASIVHLGPIANEVDPAMLARFSNSVVGVGPQGWMRRWNHAGQIYQVPWDDAPTVLPQTAVAFLSLEDIADPATLDRYRELANILVVTNSADGCVLYLRGEERRFPAPTVTLVDATGAGDIFAASYLVRFYQTAGDAWEAARFANEIAAVSVTRRGLPAKMAAIRAHMGQLIQPSAAASAR